VLLYPNGWSSVKVMSVVEDDGESRVPFDRECRLGGGESVADLVVACQRVPLGDSGVPAVDRTLCGAGRGREVPDASVRVGDAQRDLVKEGDKRRLTGQVQKFGRLDRPVGALAQKYDVARRM